mmetsp:Transcript_24318/g.78058  ORF Transcript_24318/g.78058 Transcript_24318/m.78058 type:complete len:83 (-) Transcript_24318:8-256(-)
MATLRKRSMTAVGEGVLLERLSVRCLRKPGSDERDAEAADAGVKYSKRSQEEEEENASGSYALPDRLVTSLHKSLLHTCFST